MNDLELKAYDIKAGYVAWCRGEVARQQAEEAFDWFVRALKADAWDEAYWQGVEDERTAEAVQMGVGPNRNNPYREDT